MKMTTHGERILDATSYLGMAAGIGLLAPAGLLPGMTLMVLPAMALLVPSMIYGMR